LADGNESITAILDDIGESHRSMLPLLGNLASASPTQVTELKKALEAARVELLGKQKAEERVAAALEAQLRLQGGELDEMACREEAQRLRRRKRVSERSIAVVDRVRENVLEAVLPNTMAYMRLLLPLLTAGRYHDAQLDSESYRIEVWDSQIQEFVEKDIFSGATQDQFSLALRLGFALAALPQERGARPGFLFLDEPVAGFDGVRRDALLKLLTDGEFAPYFPQVFLAVPSGVFDRNPLPHLVRIDQGRVIENTLPAA
jgi:DNA repair exonuclease SbcCD ATPase subunit